MHVYYVSREVCRSSSTIIINGCLKQGTYNGHINQAPALFDKNVAAAEFVASKHQMFMIR